MMRRVKKDFRIKPLFPFLYSKNQKNGQKLGELFVLDNNDGSL